MKMKKSIYIYLFTILTLSCKNEAPVIDYAVVLGKFENTSEDEIILSNMVDRKVSDTINVNPDGTFKDTIRLQKGHYYLKYDKSMSPIYIEEGYQLNITANVKYLDSTMNITGNGSEENLFLKERKNKVDEFDGDENFYMLNEEEFKEKIKQKKAIQDELIAENKKIAPQFKSSQKRDIEYEYLVALNNYESYHEYYTKKPDFKVSENFLDKTKTIAFDSEEDYSISRAYKNLVASHYIDEAKKMSESDSLPEDVARIIAYGKIPIEKIRTDLLNNAIFGITVTKHLNDYYGAFKTASTNQEQMKTIDAYYDKLKMIQVGEPSPKFHKYENYASGDSSLDDFKGKYVYIDVWATWCGPCLAQIPALKAIEKLYHDRNIEFVSISVDKSKDYEKWKTMIKERELGGVQLIADKDFESNFIKDYVIRGIPKFILLDPKGNIVNANAPRPSDKKLIDLFDELSI